MKQSFVAVVRSEHLSYLDQVLKDEGEVVAADEAALERVAQIVDVTGAQVVFVSVSTATLREDMALIEGLCAAKPLLSVIGLAAQADNGLLLAAVRAGVRDFLTTDTRPAEVASLLRRLRERIPVPGPVAGANGRVTALVSARPGTDAPMFALHLAIALQQGHEGRHSLLLDLGVPHGDSLTFLGLSGSYGFNDAVRSLRRMDATLIDSAFARHGSGLCLLSMPEDPTAVGEISSADIYVLLGTLRRYFSEVVVHLGGLPRSDFLYLLLGSADRVLVVVEQSVPSCKQNMQLVKHIADHKISLGSAALVIDRYLPSIPPDADSLAKGFDLPVFATLPPSGMARLRMMNSGESLFAGAPRDPYALAVRRVAERIAGNTEERHDDKASVAVRLRSWIGAARG